MTPPPIYAHALNLYNAFYEASLEADEQLATDFGVHVGDRLFIGHWSTTFIGRNGLPGESTQQKAYAWLQNIGCLEVLRRGGRDYPGVILLRREPNKEDAKGAPNDTRQIRNGKLGVVEAAIQGHSGRIGDLEDNVSDLRGEINALTRSVELELRKLSARFEEALKLQESGE
jgi:hypothetical protein